MAGYIGANTSSVTNNQNAAERRKKFTFTANTTVLSGLNFLPDKIHIFHNGIRLVKTTDYTEAADGQSVTLVNAAQAGDEVVAVTFAQDPASNTDFVSAATGGTFSGDVTMASGTTLDASAGLTTPAGHVVQVKQASSNTRFNFTSTSFVDTSLFSLSFDNNISATSKVLVQVEASIGEDQNSGWAQPCVLTIYESGTNIGDDYNDGIVSGHGVDANLNTSQYTVERLSGSKFYTPSSTSPVYTLRVKSQGGISRTIGGPNNSGAAYQTGGTRITIMEVAQ